MATTKLSGDDFLALFLRGIGSPTTVEWPTADAMSVINMAAIEIGLEHGELIPMLMKSEDITTVANEPEYEMTDSEVLMILHLSSSFISRLKPKNLEYRLRIGTQTTSDPWAYHLTGGSNDGKWNVTLIATPSEAGKTITIHYLGIPRTIEQGDNVNTSIFPQAYDMAIVQRSIMLGKSLSTQVKDAREQAVFAAEAERRAKISAHATQHLWKLGGFQWINGGGR